MDNLVGQQFDRYKLIRYLGDGAFADVYLGEHMYLKKSVAVKVLRMHLSNSDGESFAIEASTVANLEHPHIVQVLDSGVYHNIPFLVMNYASHGTLRQRHPDHTILSPTVVVSYVKQVASALQYAHDRKLIHRDVKPHNILLGPEDELWLSDFGLAMIAHSTMSQITENTGGTPGYMAPEQFVGKTCPASDQYALAVMTYEWLCGERPFQGSHSELFNQHTFAPVPALREKLSTISPAIEEVVLTALAKAPHERFASVQAFANALEQAYLLASSGSDLPAPSSQKDIPPMVRQPTAIFDAFDTSTPTVLSPMRSFPSAQDAIALASDKFSSAAEDKHIPGFSNAPVLPGATFKEPETPMPPVPPAFPILPAATFKEPETPTPPVPAVPPQLQPSTKRGISRRRVLVGLGGAIVLISGAAIAWKFASATNGSTVTHSSIIQVPPHAATPTSAPVTVPPAPVPVGTPIFTYRVQKSGVKAAAWSPNGQFIASGGDDHTVHIWNAISGDEILKPPYSGHTAGLNAVAWSPDGKFIASSGEDTTVHVWNATSGQDIFPPYTQHTQTVRAVAWSPDGRFIASGSEDETVRVWYAANGNPLFSYRHNGKVTSVAWSPNGAYIASASFDGTVQVRSSINGNMAYPPLSPLFHPQLKGERAVAWSLDGKYIVSGGDNNNVYLWDATTGKLTLTFSGHTYSIQAVAWSPDGQYIASGSFDSTVKIWSLATKKPILTYRHHKGQVWSVAWSPDGQRIASASVDGTADGTVQIWKPL